MGLFRDMGRAQQMSAAEMVFEPARRLDTLVRDAASGDERRRTDYAGTVWYGGRPEFIGKHPLPGDTAAQISGTFWLPDSHVYGAAATAGADIQTSAAVQGGLATTSGGNLLILDFAAALGDDPSGSGTSRVYAAVSAVASLPFGVAYRVTVVCAPALVRPAV